MAAAESHWPKLPGDEEGDLRAMLDRTWAKLESREEIREECREELAAHRWFIKEANRFWVDRYLDDKSPVGRDAFDAFINEVVIVHRDKPKEAGLLDGSE